MPKQKISKVNPYTRALIIIICSVLVIVGVIITVSIIKNKSKTATAENALKTAGIDTTAVTKLIERDNFALEIEIVPNKSPIVFLCSKKDNKWNYENSITCELSTQRNNSYILSNKDNTTAFAIVFSSDDKSSTLKLLADDKSTKSPLASMKANNNSVYAFEFNSPLKDNHSYTVIEYNAAGKELNSPNFRFNDGSFHIICNGTDYNYKVSECEELATSFSNRIGNLTPDFSNFQRKADKDYEFAIIYNSKTNTILTPKNLPSGGVQYKNVSILMPLEGDDSHIIYLDEASQGLICNTSPDTLKSKTLTLISGKDN